jgi:hypothetical protein
LALALAVVQAELHADGIELGVRYEPGGIAQIEELRAARVAVIDAYATSGQLSESDAEQARVALNEAIPVIMEQVMFADSSFDLHLAHLNRRVLLLNRVDQGLGRENELLGRDGDTCAVLAAVRARIAANEYFLEHARTDLEQVTLELSTHNADRQALLAAGNDTPEGWHERRDELQTEYERALEVESRTATLDTLQADEELYDADCGAP